MPQPNFDRTPKRNALLAALPEAELKAFEPLLTFEEMAFKRVLQEPERPIDSVWFPISGVHSIVSPMVDGQVVELATVGREGLIGLPLVLASRAIAQTILVQIPGEGYRISAEQFTRAIEEFPSLRRLSLRYALALMTQIAQGSACNRLHPVEARCSRWLLMTHDRVSGDSFPLTQEFLAQMLGVTRPSVSIAAGMLQKAGLIRYSRGRIDVLDRPGLEAATCECYTIITQEFRRLLD